MYSTPLSHSKRSVLFAPVPFPCRSFRFNCRTSSKRYILRVSNEKAESSKSKPKKSKVKEFIRTDYSVGVAGVVAATVATRSTVFVAKEVASEFKRGVRTIYDSVAKFQNNLMKEQFDPKIPIQKSSVFVYVVAKQDKERILQKKVYQKLGKTVPQVGQLQPQQFGARVKRSVAEQNISKTFQNAQSVKKLQEQVPGQSFQQDEIVIQSQESDDIVQRPDELVNLNTLLKNEQVEEKQPSNEVKTQGFFGDLPPNITQFQQMNTIQEVMDISSIKKASGEPKEEEEAKEGFFNDLPPSMVVEKFETGSLPDSFLKSSDDTTKSSQNFKDDNLLQENSEIFKEQDSNSQQSDLAQESEAQVYPNILASSQQAQQEVLQNQTYVPSSNFYIVYQHITSPDQKIKAPLVSINTPALPVPIRFVDMIYFQWGEKTQKTEDIVEQSFQAQENQEIAQQLDSKEAVTNFESEETTITPTESIPATKEFFDATKQSASRANVENKKEEEVVTQLKQKKQVKLLEEVTYLEEDLQSQAEQEVSLVEESKPQLQIAKQEEVIIQQLPVQTDSQQTPDQDQISYDQILIQQLEKTEESDDEENLETLSSSSTLQEQVEIEVNQKKQLEQPLFSGQENMLSEDIQQEEQELGSVEDTIVIADNEVDERQLLQEKEKREVIGMEQQATEVAFVEPEETQKRRRVLKFNVVLNYPLERGV